MGARQQPNTAPETPSTNEFGNDNYLECERAHNQICALAFELAQSFSRFYAAHHILSEENETLRSNRPATCRLALRQLEALLNLLGIEVPERM